MTYKRQQEQEITILNFDTSNYAMFSIGEIQEELAEFAIGPFGKKTLGQRLDVATGQVKAHLRRTKTGGISLVKAGYRKSAAALGKAKKAGGKALSQATTAIKKNPRLSAAAAGLSVAGGIGSYALGKRSRRKRRMAS